MTVYVKCDFYLPNYLPHNLQTIKNNIDIFYTVMPELDLKPADTGLSYTITKAHINAYWDLVYKTSDGWSRGSRTATTSYNCHGHSSGRNHWMEILPSWQNDYNVATAAAYMCPGAIYGNVSHTGKVDGIVNVNDNNGVLIARGIFQISEKYQASAVYERVIYDIDAYPPGEVIPIVGSPFFGITPLGYTIPNSPFWVPKP